MKKLKYVQSYIDDQYYQVRDKDDAIKASNMLARIKENIMTLKNYLVENKSKYEEMIPYITQLSEKIKGVVISESAENSNYTSYSVNKGEEIVFCLRSKEDGRMHDINLVMYVALHEIAHVACPEYGHTDLFKKIFAFFVKIAIEINIYRKIEFNEDPMEYCGLTITESII